MAAALLFPVATMALKQAIESGGKRKGDEWGTVFVSNMAVALVCLPLLLMESGTSGESAAQDGPAPLRRV